MIMTRTFVQGSLPQIPVPLQTAASGGWTRLRHFLETALVIAAERRQLASLDDRMLRDIGLSRSMIERETARDFFDVPPERWPRF